MSNGTASTVLTRNQEPTGTQTITIDPTTSQEVTPLTSDAEEHFAGTIRLAGATSPNRRVRWDDNVVDNEGLGKKKSKICCIYSKPRAFGESDSDESDTDSETDSDLSDDEKVHRAKRRATPNAYEKANYSKHPQGCKHKNTHSHHHSH
ncbi:Type 1 phosphatases regulator ypi1 [Basidiobolus ranarum]|uniref:Type 1 phosphatases regulator n=1 Tax=Basidiobolus ranarum TaxID=34480 RepID=A0ABR2WT16_9FUNG